MANDALGSRKCSMSRDVKGRLPTFGQGTTYGFDALVSINDRAQKSIACSESSFYFQSQSSSLGN